MNYLKLLIAFAFFWALISCAQQSTVVLKAYSDSSDDEKLIKVEPPTYPVLQRETGIEGYVVIEFDLNEEGRVENATVIDDKPEGVFRDAALTSVNSSRYKPRLENGKPIRVENKITRVWFRLGGDSKHHKSRSLVSCENTFAADTLSNRDCERIQ